MPASTSLTRALLRLTLLLAMVLGILSAATSGPTAQAAGFGRRPCGPGNAMYCDYIDRIGIDYLNDTVPMPLAEDINSGEIFSNRLAKFHVYGLNASPRAFINVTTEICALSVRISTPLGGGEPGGSFQYSTANNNPTLYFAPPRLGQVDRVYFLDFGYHCKFTGTHTERFTLLVRGTDDSSSEPPAAEPAPAVGEPGNSSARASTPPAQASQFEVSVETGPGEVMQAHPFTATVRVTNHGMEAAGPGRITFNWPENVWFQPATWSQFYTYSWHWRLGFWFDPGEIAPGATATLTLAGTASSPDPAFLTASTYDGTYVQHRTDFTVLPEPRPELTGTTQGLQVTASGAGTRRRFELSGQLRVSNDGDVEASATRVLLLLSDDRTPGPEDRLLALSDVPALPPGASTELDLSHKLAGRLSWERGKYLLALVDAGNRTAEVNERNNLMVIGPIGPTR
jgi:hypothetical protein